jgi:hypothetical protein
MDTDENPKPNKFLAFNICVYLCSSVVAFCFGASPRSWWPCRGAAAAGLMLMCAAGAAAEADRERLLDGFDDLTPWTVSGSDEVKTRMRRASDGEGGALCMDFDFGRVSGYAVAARELPLEFPENFEFILRLRGEGPPNSLQFKLVDTTGENVWWVHRPDYVFSREWQEVRFKKRHVAFAWGPAADRELKRSARLELVVVRGQEGGSGTACFDRLSFRELPSSRVAAAPALRATSTLAPTQPLHALDGSATTAWRSDPTAGPEQMLTLDFVRPREFGGLVLHWLPGAFASRYSIEFSDDGERWREVRRVAAGNGGPDPHLLPESETRYVRVRLQDGPAKAYALAEIEIKDVAWGQSPNAFFEALAKAAPRGHYPRGFSGEQSYWTVLGIDGGAMQGLLSEDGALEIGPRSGSIEPFLLADGRLITWADVKTEHSLAESYLPIPTVVWRHHDLSLRVTAYAAGGDHARSQLIADYTVENLSDRPRAVTLALALRPFQVNPPHQFLNIAGGVARVDELSWDGEALIINGRQHVLPLRRPDDVIVAPFESGNVPEILSQARPGVPRLRDESGFASAVLLYRLDLPARGTRRLGLTAPLAGSPVLPDDDAAAWLDRQQAATAAEWREKLNRVALSVPPAAQPIADSLRTALAHILINRGGAALQPGARAYARSWIRDGAMMADELARVGHAAVGRDFVEWFAPYQFASGKVPCCVDGRGSDPVVENDSHGQFLYLVAQQYRYSRDDAWLESLWPRVASAASYMDSLRLKERSALNQTPERQVYFGLMPPSISHEGYSDKPAYSYWDDFWTLAGYDAAIAIARALGRGGDVPRISRQREEFSRDLHASLRASIARHRVDYLPASADRGDFDATSTTIALSVAGQQAKLPQRELRQTFERYWNEFVARRGGTEWDVYTPYELRSVGTFVRLGWRERAGQLLDGFLADRRPPGWNQWAEVIGREARQPRFVGDMPHGWVASDYVRSVLDLFVYERQEDRSLVLAAGVPHDWLTGQGSGVRNLRTPYGELSYNLRRDGQRVVLTIEEGLRPPPGGLVFGWPYAAPPGPAVLNGRPIRWENGRELRIRKLPAVIEITVPGEASQVKRPR